MNIWKRNSEATVHRRRLAVGVIAAIQRIRGDLNVSSAEIATVLRAIARNYEAGQDMGVMQEKLKNWT